MGRFYYKVDDGSEQLVLLTGESLLPLLVHDIIEAEQVDGLVRVNYLQGLDGVLTHRLLKLLPRKEGKRWLIGIIMTQVKKAKKCQAQKGKRKGNKKHKQRQTWLNLNSLCPSLNEKCDPVVSSSLCTGFKMEQKCAGGITRQAAGPITS